MNASTNKIVATVAVFAINLYHVLHIIVFPLMIPQLLIVSTHVKNQ